MVQYFTLIIADFDYRFRNIYSRQESYMLNSKYHIGEMIIDFNQINVITKIENNRIFYKPINNENDRCISSIPLNNLSLAHMRLLMTKSEVKNLLENLPYEKAIDIPCNSNRINSSNFLKEIIYLNNPQRTAKVLILLEKLKKDSKLSSTDESLYDQALSHLTNEISVVTKTSFESVKEKILKALG